MPSGHDDEATQVMARPVAHELEPRRETAERNPSPRPAAGGPALHGEAQATRRSPAKPQTPAPRPSFSDERTLTMRAAPLIRRTIAQPTRAPRSEPPLTRREDRAGLRQDTSTLPRTQRSQLPAPDSRLVSEPPAPPPPPTLRRDSRTPAWGADKTTQGDHQRSFRPLSTDEQRSPAPPARRQPPIAQSFPHGQAMARTKETVTQGALDRGLRTTGEPRASAQLPALPQQPARPTAERPTAERPNAPQPNDALRAFDGALATQRTDERASSFAEAPLFRATPALAMPVAYEPTARASVRAPTAFSPPVDAGVLSPNLPRHSDPGPSARDRTRGALAGGCLLMGLPLAMATVVVAVLALR